MSELRDIALAMRAQSKSLAKIEMDLADAAAAADSIAQSLTRIAESHQELAQTLREVSLSTSAIPGMFSAVRTVSSQVIELTGRLNKYVDSSAEQGGRIRSRLAKLEEVALGKR